MHVVFAVIGKRGKAMVKVKDHVCRDNLKLMFRMQIKGTEVIKMRAYCVVCSKTFVCSYLLESMEEYKQ